MSSAMWTQLFRETMRMPPRTLKTMNQGSVAPRWMQFLRGVVPVGLGMCDSLNLGRDLVEFLTVMP